MSQKKTVQIIRLLIKKFYDQYRNAKQTNKTVLNFAIKSFFVEIKQFLIRFLNEVNLYVQEAYMSHRNVFMLKEKNTLSLENKIMKDSSTANNSMIENNTTTMNIDENKTTSQNIDEKIIIFQKRKTFDRFDAQSMSEKSSTKKTKASNLHEDDNVKKSIKYSFEKKKNVSYEDKNSNETSNFFSFFDTFSNESDNEKTEIENNSDQYFSNQLNNDNETLMITTKIMNELLLKTQITKKLRV